MKRRFTTILAGVLAGNTAFFATQAIATQEMQPTMQATDRYMIIDLAGIPLDQAQNNVDALIPDDTQLTEDSSSLSEQDELEMSTELADQSESSVSEETLPYYLSLSSVDAAKVAYFDKLDELESNLSQTDPDIAGTLTYAVSDIHAGEPMISYLLDQYAGIVHLTPEVSTPNESSAAVENQEETDEAASRSLEGKVDEDTSETTSQDVAKADPTKPSKPSEKSSSESATKPTTKAPETTKPASTKPAQTTKASETAATVAPTAATTAPPNTSPAPTTTAHTHNWVAVTKIVHHDAVTSQVWKEDSAAWDETVVTKAAWDEQVLVTAAWDEPVYEWVAICNRCGHRFIEGEDVSVHMEAGCWSSWHHEQIQTSTLHHDAVYSTVHHDAETTTVHHDAVYTTIHHDAETTVVHHEATGHYETDETVTTGYKCSGCGATK